MSKENKVFTSVKNAVNEANTLLRNTEKFIEAASLLIVSYSAYWTAFNVPLRNEYKYALLFAAVLIGLRGATEFLRHINKK